MLGKVINTILNTVYPDSLYCICCGKIIDETRPYSLCNDCMEILKWAGDRTCRKCGKPLSSNNPTNTCFSCREHSHSYNRGFCCTEYGSGERKIVFSLKYDNRPDIAAHIGEIMTHRMLAEMRAWEFDAEYDLIVPVPVSTERLHSRGYNQAALVAGSFARNMGMTHKYYGEILRRRKSTSVMKYLSPEERRVNIRGSFEIIKRRRPLVEGANCLIIDDIYTTGATVDEVASVLKDNGAGKIDFLSFASGADVIKS